MRGRWLGLVIGLILGAGSVPQVQAEYLFGVTTSNRLVAFESTNPGTYLLNVAITGLQPAEDILGLDIRPATNTFYALGASNRIYTVNRTTGVAAVVGSAGAFSLSGTSFGFDFNPVVDRIRITSNTGQNLRVHPDTGALVLSDTALTYAAGDPNAGASPNVAGSAYINNVPNATSTLLYGIDSSLDILVTQNPPNNGVLNTIGSLGFNTSDLVGFDVSNFSGIAYASLTAPGSPGFSQLFSINLATGAATLVGGIGVNSANNAPLIGLAAVPEPSSVALLGLGIGLAGIVLRRHRRAN